MYILGLKYPGHDATAVLLKNNHVVFASAQERFDQRKHSHAFPMEAIKCALDMASINIEQVDIVVFQYNYPLSYRNMVARTFMNYFPLATSSSLANLRYQMAKKAVGERDIRKLGFKGPIYYVDHHASHRASAYFPSPFERAAVLIIDGRGERASTTFSLAEGNRFINLKHVDYPHSLGYLYAAVTSYLGFCPDSDEGKIMGLSSYAEPEYINTFRHIVRLLPEGGFALDMSYFNYHTRVGSYFSKRFLKEFGPPRRPEEPLTSHHKIIAASLQRITEETVLHFVKWLKDKTGADNLCLGGGVALNSVTNGRIMREMGFDGIFVQPAAGDDGSALGAALEIYHRLSGTPRYPLRYFDPYLGKGHSDEEIKKFLDDKRIPYRKYSDIERVTAKILSEGNIVGWFQGRAEFGPRALGNRSILADPRFADMKDKVNRKVKFREDFRPFAPATLEEYVGELFDSIQPSPYMLMVYNVLPVVRDTIPAVTHVDGTARVQSVNESQNKKFYRLITEFKKLTGVPAILNTSFNVKGKPIVNNPEDAFECFWNTEMDYLVMGDFLIAKKEGALKNDPIEKIEICS
ncbi:hypothetical protein SY88_06505 [Clostridiales bacterium PH28_bin88]|nr:hypothetical protein SY88_06505 [Clostridiales bacterium PH28_bin88]